MSAHELISVVEVSDEVWSKHPDYVLLLLGIDGLGSGASDAHSEAALSEAENHARELLQTTPIEEIPQVGLWREKFLSFGVKPRVAKSSTEALIRRTPDGLPRVNYLTDVYNAVSVKHRVPIGGEDADKYQGTPRLVVASGSEEFDTREQGEDVVVTVEPEEIIWRDDQGVTCRRWNWRQGLRTRITEETNNVIFIIEGIGSTARADVEAAGKELSELVSAKWPEAQIEQRLITSSS